MKRHFMTKAASNAAVALSMAKEVWCKEGLTNGNYSNVQDLVQLINDTSLILIAACERHASMAQDTESTPT